MIDFEKTPQDNPIIQASAWREDEGCFPYRIILWMRQYGNFVTHLQIKPEGLTPYFTLEHGNYDMKLDEAVEDYVKRCATYSVNPFPISPMDARMTQS